MSSTASRSNLEADSDSTLLEALMKQAAGGDSEALDELCARHRERLERMVRLRLNRRLHGVVDSSEVLDAAKSRVGDQLAAYLDNPQVPIFLWLREMAGSALAEIEQRHLGDQTQDAGGVSLHRGALPGANSMSLAAQLLGSVESKSEEVVKADLRIRVQEVLNDMDPTDREILALKHFEQLSTDEMAQLLELSKKDVGKRYLRAIKQLRAAMSQGGTGFAGL